MQIANKLMKARKLRVKAHTLGIDSNFNILYANVYSACRGQI